MIINLFSIFDPVSSIKLFSNWLSIFLIFLLIPLNYWCINNRVNLTLKNLESFIIREFKLLITKDSNLLLFIVSIFVFILLNNRIGLFPYIFTGSRHLAFSLSFSLSIWLGLLFFRWLKNSYNTLIHLIPQGTPVALIPFITLIEIVSNLIRPLILSIRLRANIIAGHLLLRLFRSTFLVLPSLIPFLFLALRALLILEVAVAFIQTYVLRILVVLYSREAIN